jgi:uncharacterized protein YciI
MRVALICKDKPGSLVKRAENRDAHLRYIRESGVVEQAGPFLNEFGEMIGSLVILDVENVVAAQEWAAQDPYARAGLFADVYIQEWKKVI